MIAGPGRLPPAPGLLRTLRFDSDPLQIQSDPSSSSRAGRLSGDRHDSSRAALPYDSARDVRNEFTTAVLIGFAACRVLVPAWVLAGAFFKYLEWDPGLLPRQTVLPLA